MAYTEEAGPNDMSSNQIEGEITKQDRKRQNREAILKIQSQQEMKTPLQHYEQLRNDGAMQIKEQLKPVIIIPKPGAKDDEGYEDNHQEENKNKIFDVLNYEDNKDPDDLSYIQILKDKYRIDGLIAQTYKNVF